MFHNQILKTAFFGGTRWRGFAIRVFSIPIAIYTYDAGGERIIKHSNTSASIYLNGKKVADTIQTDTIQTDATLYPSGMLVARVIPSEGEESPSTLGYPIARIYNPCFKNHYIDKILE